ncbi:MAG: tRNA (N6-threonylcarbamoyladenosine(37)-N6)-methyltransferase TrmO [Deltaproteobacteria bacterium]|nr:tRNA (N6-threonylcarbamoyladenosine(37)-N6)-methyltransferase TrmO [Deltaproteobacteria bacterium]
MTVFKKINDFKLIINYMKECAFPQKQKIISRIDSGETFRVFGSFHGEIPEGLLVFDSEGEIIFFHVHEKYRRQKTGSGLLSFALENITVEENVFDSIRVKVSAEYLNFFIKNGFLYHYSVEEGGVKLPVFYRAVFEKHWNIKSIGVIHSPFTERRDMPIQPSGGEKITGEVHIFSEFQSGLKDLDGFSHIILIYRFHKSTGFKNTVVPFMDTTSRGMFATRTPNRPSGLGLSIVKLEKIEKNVLYISGVDVLNSTPLYDIKPWIHNFDFPGESKSGWMNRDSDEVKRKRSDGRFITED